MKNKLLFTLKFIFTIMSLVIIYETNLEWFYYGYAWTRRYAIYTAIISIMLSSISLGYALAQNRQKTYAIASLLQLIMICLATSGDFYNFLELCLYAVPALIIELIILIVWKIKLKHK